MIASNLLFIKSKTEYSSILHSLQNIATFLDDFGGLTYGRTVLLPPCKVFSLNRIWLSLTATFKNAVYCSNHYCLSDANILLRKYRDDLFFYLYMLLYSLDPLNNQDPEYLEKEINIRAWTENTLNNKKRRLLHSEIMKSIGKNPLLQDAVKKHNLESMFKEIDSALNDYVHGNGYNYYNTPVYFEKDVVIKESLEELLLRARGITVTFVFLFALCAPYYIASTDYTDYLECGMDPPFDSQYYVAPFIKDFLNKNSKYLPGNCYHYLKNHVYMQL